MRIFLWLIILMPLSGNATTTEWTGGASDHDWFNAANWNMGVPGLLDTAIVGTDSVNITGVVDIKYLEVKDLARLVISPNGKLRILNSDDVGILCTKSTIYNYGLIRVFNSGAEGIIVSGDSQLFNFMGSNLFIQSTGSYSSHLRLGGRLLNFPGSEMRIDSCFSPLLNDGILLNRGEIGIYVSEATAIFNNGCITNEGVIIIDSTGTTALENNTGGVINNSDSLIIRRTSDELAGMYPILNRDSIHNMSGGVVLIQESNNTYGMRTFAGSTTRNDGSVIIRNQETGLRLEEGTFINNGLLDILSKTGGIQISSMVINDDLGRIIIGSENDEMGSGSAINITAAGEFKNYGHVLLKDDFFKAFNVSDGKVHNYDSINIRVTNFFTGVFNNQDTFYNYKSGVLIIDNSILHTISTCAVNTIDGYFKNEGEVHVRTDGSNCFLNSGTLTNDSLMVLSSPSIGITNNGDVFTNSSSGIIEISGTSHAIKNDSNMVNFGNIMVDDIAAVGLENSGLFTNEGVLFVTDVLQTGILNNGTLINTDSILLYDVQFTGILNTDSIFFEASSVVNIDLISTSFDPMFIQNEQTVTNHGIIILDALNVDPGNGNGIYCVSDSYWLNTSSSEITLSNFDSVIDWLVIDVTAEFVTFGVMTLD